MLNRYPFNLHAGATPLMRDFEQLFRELHPEAAGPRELIPAADIYETEAGLTLQVDLPGHDAKAIEVKVEKDVLTLRSERKPEGQGEGTQTRRRERGFGVYARSFVLPRTVDTTKVEARYDNGVLTLTLPRREESKPRVVEVKVQQ
jgi:HSP20 family protein